MCASATCPHVLEQPFNHTTSQFSLNLHFHFVPLNEIMPPLSIFQQSSPKKRVSVLFINLGTLRRVPVWEKKEILIGFLFLTMKM